MARALCYNTCKYLTVTLYILVVLLSRLSILCAGAVKDSVVGEERIAQYLLAILNSRRTPLHWDRLGNERMRTAPEFDGRNKNIFADSIPKRRRQLNVSDSDALYIEVLIFTNSMLL